MSGGRILALCGGVGGAKLAAGLADVLGDRLSIVVNTGDDFTHLGLRICPDLDSVVYALAGLNDTSRGWGRADESWQFFEALAELGSPDWFRLGDRDLAMHVLRTARLTAGESLRTVTGDIARNLGVSAQVVPMSDQPVATIVETDDGDLAFQEYFVARQCQPVVRGLRFAGASEAPPAPELISQSWDAVIICPSNPFVSIDPILALHGVRRGLARRRCPVIAVSPFIGGKAVKGPAAKMFAERGLAVGGAALADHYGGLLDALIVDDGDTLAGRPGLAVHRADILMRDRVDRVRLARFCLDLVSSPSSVGRYAHVR